ncbi:MAG: outer membrane beta-barrel protein [Bacteroidales bacterium]|nr:outer membrane beta-barrel protein [Bacteroidales bacterium]MBR3412201.1 outer membrane beta-barrel protein [Bacteroidales bacterium]
MKKKQRLAVTLFLAITGMSNAQYVVTGQLLSAKDKQPIPFANIAMMRASDSTFLRGVITDDKGVFNINNDTIATVLRISAMGYETQFLAVPNTRDGGPTGLGKIDMGSIVMHEGAMLLDVVKITEKRPLYTVDGEKDLYNVAEDASIQTGNASDALQNAPGVEVDVEGNVTLNGQSVEVWINDRPSHLEGEALKQYIKMLPANSIDRIEVMKNPSARYGGGSPVVNIVTNQRMLKNSFVSLGANGSSRPSISPWLSYVYSNEKFNISAYVSYSSSHSENTRKGGGSMFDEDSVLSREWDYLTTGSSHNHYVWANLNASYQFDSMNSISGWFGTYPNYSTDKSDGQMSRTEYLFNPGNYNNTTVGSSNNMNYGGYGGIDFTHKFNNEGHQMSVNFNGNFWGYNGDSKKECTYPFQPQMNYNEYTQHKMFDGSGSLGVDYSLPYSKNGEIEAGIEFGMEADNDYYRRDTFDYAQHLFFSDYLMSDTMHTPGRNLDGYLTWRRKWGDFTLKLGGRGRYVYVKDWHEGLPQYDVETHNFTFSPSVNMSYRTKDMHNFSLSYRMNTIKPTAGMLTSYEKYGVESLSTGNPLLEPSYTHNADLSWNKYFSKFGSVGANASYRAKYNEINSINDARYVDFFGRVVDYRMPFNCSDARRFSLNANCMYRPTAFFNVRLNMGLTDDWYSVIVRTNEPPVVDRKVSFDIRGKVWAKLWNKLEVFVSGYYNSPGHGWSTLSVSHERKGIDLGMGADFFDRKLSLYFNASDIFNWNVWGSTNINPYNTTTSDVKYNSRYVTFGVTLRFGKMELESRAQTGAREGSVGGE